MEKFIKEKQRFSIVARIKSTARAWRGMIVVIKTTHNAWVHIFFAFLAIFLGIIFSISMVEWGLLVLAIGLVIVTEIVNTAIEIDIDLTSPTYHPYARDTKDVAAAAVLLSALVSLVVGGIIFIPKILLLF